jgi:CubicO group peptidase (beta-lactamase class C family)
MSSRVLEAAAGEWWYGYGLGTFVEDGHTIIGHGGGVPGFVSALTADMDAGVGAVVLVNTAFDPAPIASYARQLLRAAVTGSSVPNAPALSDPTIVEDASEYEGSYLGHNGSFRLVAEDHRLLMDWRGRRLILERRGVDAFLVPHEDFTLFLLWC